MTDGKKLRKGQDLTGRTYGMLTALRPATSTGKKLKWVYVCRCGTECTKVGADVTKDTKKGRVPSCGCITRQLQSAARVSHGMSRHPAYAVYRSMVDRCRLPSHQAWVNYGGRGITVCERWLRGFEVFWSDMAEGYGPNVQLDRRDNSAGYSPENCRWVPAKVNANNKRTNVVISTPRGSMTVAQASEVSGIGVTTLHYRLRHNWPTRRLFDPPDFRNRGASMTS